MIDRLEYFFRDLRRWFSRSEWTIRLLNLPVSRDSASKPGLLLIQIDGLARSQMERALERGRLPYLKRLIQRENYETRTFYPGLPSSTPAVQAELHYGVPCAVPAFSFLDHESGRILTMFNPDAAQKVEGSLKLKHKGILEGGSSWSNIYTGGANTDECHFCTASLGIGDIFRTRAVVRFVTLPLLHFVSLLRLAGLLIVEAGLAVWDLIHGVRRGERFVKEFKFIFARVVVCIGLRELITIGAKVDLARGQPIIHINFLGYDEQAHRRGPSSAFAHWSLKGIDRAIKNLAHAAHRSRRRHYQLWVFSDHGQERTRRFLDEKGNAIEGVIRRGILGAGETNNRQERDQMRISRAQLARRRKSRKGLLQLIEAEPLTEREKKSFAVAALGPVGLVYLFHPHALSQRAELAKRLVREYRVPGALLRHESGEVEWIHPEGSCLLSDEAAVPLPHSAELKRWLLDDLKRLVNQRYAGDLILLGWSPRGNHASFSEEHGAHAGPGLDETQGFVLTPPLTRFPEGVNDVLRPGDLRKAVQHYLGRERIPFKRSSQAGASQKKLRIMTYNVHGCRGMDGRISATRIAHVIERYRPDIVALQEFDLGRTRSARSDQPREIADALGMHVQFCPTMVANDEQYGHALLSRWPMKLLRTDVLFGGERHRHLEPRGALWVVVDLNGTKLNVMNTHFGLRRGERREQANDILGEKWIGAIDPEDPLLLCGDFNMGPRSQVYRKLCRRLRDVQTGVEDAAPVKTFATFRPFARIDHIFVSRHFRATTIRAPRNYLTRVASDHLPLIAELNWQNSQP